MPAANASARGTALAMLGAVLKPQLHPGGSSAGATAGRVNRASKDFNVSAGDELVHKAVRGGLKVLAGMEKKRMSWCVGPALMLCSGRSCSSRRGFRGAFVFYECCVLVEVVLVEEGAGLCRSSTNRGVVEGV